MPNDREEADCKHYAECLLQFSPDPVLLVERDGRIHRANPLALALFGYTAAELVGQPIEILVPERFRESHAGLRGAYIKAPKGRSMGSGLTILGCHKSGREIPLDIMLSPREHSGQGLVVAVIRDITHLHELQRQATEQAAHMERLSRAKDTLLGVAAHDLRNPLSVIRGYSELLSEGTLGELSERQHKVVEHLLHTSDYMIRLVDDLLDFAALESGRLQLRPERTNLLALVEDVVALERAAASQKGSAVELEALHPLSPLVLDPYKIRQVLHNLINNAVKFSPPQSTARVRVEHDGERVCVVVDDQGPGLSAEEQASIFEPFRQASSRPTANEHSTGLGLAIARKIVHAHGGTLSVVSELGAGATFTACFPRGALSDAVPAG